MWGYTSHLSTNNTRHATKISIVTALCDTTDHYTCRSELVSRSQTAIFSSGYARLGPSVGPSVGLNKNRLIHTKESL